MARPRPPLAPAGGRSPAAASRRARPRFPLAVLIRPAPSRAVLPEQEPDPERAFFCRESIAFALLVYSVCYNKWQYQLSNLEDLK